MDRVIRSESMYKDIFESFLDLYVRCDLSGKITMSSPSTKNILGFDSKDVIGKDITDYYLYTSRTKGLYKKLLKSKSIKNFELSLTSKEGEIISCICNLRILFNDKGKPTEVECICRDISKLVETNNKLKEAVEIAEQSLKVKDQFLANMSHEIRTPMNGIIGLMDLLEESGLTEKQLTYLSTMRHSSESLLKLMNDIIYLAKVRTKKIKPAKNDINLVSFLNDMKLLFFMEAQKKDIIITETIDNNVPKFIESDETRLSQIFANLLSNAIKFSKIDGKVQIKISVEKTLSTAIYLKVNIIDDGIGIAKRYHSKLFKTFTQVDESYSKGYVGAGLGLSISKELVELLNGEIKVESEFGKGSNFSFTFKTKEVKAPKIIIENKSSVINNIQSKILLVDDNDVNRTVAKEILENASHNVDTATDGFQALNLVESNNYDIILMDIQMPGMNGIDTMLKIRQLLKQTCPPVIALTAFSSDTDKEEFISQGFDDYQAKPFTATDIITRVGYWQKRGVAMPQHTIKAKNGLINVVNISTLNQLIQFSDFETVKLSLIEFNRETANALSISKKLIDKENYEKLGELIHTIKGNSGTLGGDQLFELSRKIEQNVRKGYFDTLHDDLKSLYLRLTEFNLEVQNTLNIALDG